MIDIKVTIEDFIESALKPAVDKAAFRNFGHAAASIRKDAISTIERSEAPSAPGAPPHTRRGLLPRAIQFSANRDGAVIGPVSSLVGQSGAAHEFGGEYKGEEYPPRPYMGPALDRGVPRFAGSWAGSVGQ